MSWFSSAHPNVGGCFEAGGGTLSSWESVFLLFLSCEVRLDEALFLYVCLSVCLWWAESSVSGCGQPRVSVCV